MTGVYVSRSFVEWDGGEWRMEAGSCRIEVGG
jgi:hypothetical protein